MSEEFHAHVVGSDDGDNVAVSTASCMNDGSIANTPVRIVSSDDYTAGVAAYLSIEQAKQHIKNVQGAIDFLES